MSDVDCEVVVIGAGASGLNAARLLVEAGRDVIVLEATDRVGGRTLSRALKSGSMIDLGGQWVGPTQTRVVALAKALNLATFKTYAAGDNIVPADGRLVRVSGAFALDPAADADIRQARGKLEALAHAIPLEQPWTHPQAPELDRMSYAAWIDQNLSTDRGRWQFRFMAPAVFSVEAHELSMLHVAFYFGSAGGVERLTATEGGGQDSRFVSGMQQLSLGLARSLGDRVRLRHPVRRIAQAATGVAVASEGLVVTGRRAIVALAPALAGRVAYQPPMPPLRDGLTQRAPMGTAIKMMLVFDTPFWRDAGLSGFARTLSDVPQLLYDNSPADLSCGVLLGFTEGAAARRWIEADASARQAAAISTAVACFGEGAAMPIEYVEHAWMGEEFARGCYAGTMPPGVWTSFGPALREPVGRIHWAGTETATNWNGYVEGALQAGERAAAEVLTALANP